MGKIENLWIKSRAVENDFDSGRKIEKVSGKHPGTGKSVYGIRRRTGKLKNAERVSEESEEYRSTTRHPRFIESTLGIKSYSELAPHLAKGVERVMASLLEMLAFAEGRLLRIHPFLDFNGRVTKMLLFVLLYRLDLPPVQLVPDEKDEKGKKEYFAALAKADIMDWQPLIEVWRKRLEGNQ